MTEDLKFRISLEDLFSKGVQKAEGHAASFDHHVVAIREHISSLTTRAVEAFGIFEAFEFLKESAQDFIRADKAAALLQFTVGKRGGLGADLKYLNEQAEELGKKSFFNPREITQAQNDLLNFGISVNKTKKSIETLTEVGVAKNTNLEELIQKIASAASTGMTRGLTRGGFGLGNLKLEKAMGDIAAENRNFQKIVDALGVRFAGSTEFMQDKDFFKMKKLSDEMEHLREQVGRELLHAFDLMLPYLKKGIDYLHDLGHWLKINSDTLKEVAIDVGIVYGAFKSMMILKQLIIAAQEFRVSLALLKLELRETTISQIALNSAMELDPYVAIATAIAAIGLAWYESKKAHDEYEKSINSAIHTAVKEEIDAVKELTEAYKTQIFHRKTAQEDAIKDERVRLENLLAIERTLQNQQHFLNPEGQANITKYMAQLSALKDASNFGKKGEKGEKGDLGLSSSEPKASRIQNITINLNQPFNQAKFTMGGGNLDPREIAFRFSELLTTVTQDAAVVATE